MKTRTCAVQQFHLRRRAGTMPVLLALAAALLTGRFASGQADAPPERETPAARDRLPGLDVPTPKVEGKLRVEFSGAKAFTEKQLRTALARQFLTIEESGLDQAGAYDTAFYFESHYRKHGYSQVTAKGEIAGPWVLRLTVNEGPLTKIGSVAVPGARSHTAPELTNYLLGPTRERFPRIKKDTALPFVEADVQSGAALVTRLYAPKSSRQCCALVLSAASWSPINCSGLRAGFSAAGELGTGVGFVGGMAG